MRARLNWINMQTIIITIKQKAMPFSLPRCLCLALPFAVPSLASQCLFLLAAHSRFRFHRPSLVGILVLLVVSFCLARTFSLQFFAMPALIAFLSAAPCHQVCIRYRFVCSLCVWARRECCLEERIHYHHYDYRYYYWQRHLSVCAQVLCIVILLVYKYDCSMRASVCSDFIFYLRHLAIYPWWSFLFCFTCRNHISSKSCLYTATSLCMHFIISLIRCGSAIVCTVYVKECTVYPYKALKYWKDTRILAPNSNKYWMPQDFMHSYRFKNL